jgi:protein-disulfide isomerase
MKDRNDWILVFSLSLNFGFLIAGGWHYVTRTKPVTPLAAAASAPAALAPEGAAAAAAAPAARVAVATEGHPSRGAVDAPVTIVEFSDFECPFCARVGPILRQLEEAYGGKVRRVYRQFPLVTLHPRARKAAEASLCADEQQRFWEMHEALFEQPLALEPSDLSAKAQRLGLDMQRFGACLDSGRFSARVEQDLQEGVRVGVTGTPAVFINGRMVSGARPYADFARIIDEELARASGS